MKQLFFINKYIQLTLSTILILLYCSFIPLFIDKGGFFTLQEAKFYVLYNNKQIIYLLLILLVLSIIIENKQNLKQWLKNSINTFDIVSLIFLAIVILSCRLSLSFKFTWLGTSGFYVGGYVLSLAILSTIVLSKAHIPLKLVCCALYITNSIILIITIIEGLGFDPLYTHQNLISSDYYNFYSTLGNTNWYSGYLSIITSISYGFFLKSKNKTLSIFLLFFITLCILNVLIIHTESLLLAFFLLLIFIIPIILNNNSYVNKTIYCLISLACCLLLFSFTSLFISINLTLNGLFRIIVLKPVTMALCVAISLIVVYLKRYDTSMKKLKPRTIVAIITAFLLFAISLMILQDPNNFGNGRGEIWLYSLSRFKNYSLKYFLIGSGPENLNSIYSAYSFENGVMLTTSHSEPIQVLMTMGILGFIAYCLILYSLFKNIITNIKKEECLPYALALIAYFGQSLVNSATVPNVLFITVTVALFLNSYITKI